MPSLLTPDPQLRPSESGTDWLPVELFRHALDNHRAGLLVNAVAAGGVALMVSPALSLLAWLWLAAMLGMNAARVMADRALRDQLHGLRRADSRSVKLALWVFHGGYVAAALLWASLALFAMPHLQIEGQFTIVVVLSALAGGATGVLAPMRRLGRAYILLLLLSGSAGLLLMSPPQTVLAILGCVFAGVMWVGHRNNHVLLLRSLRLQHENDRLVERLSESNEAIRLSNQRLEQRVHERTVELQRLSSTDALTGLLNRRGLIEAVDARSPPRTPLAVLFLDLDRFKQVNDGLGHDAGDRVLREVARRFTRAAPERAWLARWGGDEFVMVMVSPADGTALESLAEPFQHALVPPIVLGDERVQLGVSIGCAGQQRSEVAAELIAAADLAATEAKRQGRGRVLSFQQRMADHHQRRLQIVSGLRTATEDGSLWLAYQPIVRADNHARVGVETLLRWQSPRLGNVPPDEFIGIAEDSERILDLGDWVLRRALVEARLAFSEALPSLSVNVSLRQLAWSGFFDALCRCLEDTGWPAQKLAIEITESVLEHRQSEQTLVVLQRIARMGVRIHLDDFGAGYSSLSSLHRFPLHTIKIDRLFVQRLDPQACAVIEAAVRIAKGHGLMTIAEGVETEAQARMLRELGVDALQGYLFGRPQPPQLGGVGLLPG